MASGLGESVATSVSVIIATYRRPERLRNALLSLENSTSGLPDDWAAGVTIVDDDPEGSALDVATEFDTVFALGCTYVPCGSRNIAHARNAGYASALPNVDWVASIDDDVVVPPDWFATCVRALSNGRHHAVTGPLAKDFSLGPQWLTKEPFDQFGILDGRDGEDAFLCATGNNWVRSAFLREHPSLRFNPELGETGGEDMEFFYRAVAQGLNPVFSSGAAVVEVEPPARCTFRYQIRRAFWLGVSEGQVSLRLGLASRTRLILRALRRAANGGARQLPPEARSRRGARYAVAILCEALGTMAGSIGLTLRHK